jgi:hypothetical protein
MSSEHPHYDQTRTRPRPVTPVGKSPQRVIQRPRIPDRTWVPALERAQAEERPIGHVITALLDMWLSGDIELEETS